MIRLDGFWNFISYRPGLSATAEEWRGCLGDDGWLALHKQVFIGNGIVRTCAGPDGRTLQVVPMSGGRYGLVCPVTGNVEETGLAEADVKAYRLNVTALRCLVAEALGVIPDPQPVREVPRAFPVGSWAPVVGADIPAFMILPPTSRLLASEIGRLAVECDKGLILLVPKQPKLPGSLRARIERQQAAVIPLAEVVVCDAAGRFSALPAWETYRNAYCRRYLADRMVPAPEPYEFRKMGDYWTVRFNGEFTTIKDAVGQAYIAQLLACPRRKIFAPDLLEAMTGESTAARVGSAGAQADQPTLDDVKRQYLELQEDLQEAERNNDLAAQERLQHELDGLTDYLKTVKGFGGRTRQAADDADKIRRAITQAIGRTIESLGKSDKLPAAAQHLENAIRTGLFMSYEPEEELPWVL